jgi:hypothetical protein
MKARNLALRSWSLVGAALLLSGCVTPKLWEDTTFRQPKSPSNLQFFLHAQRRDVLVTYDEARDTGTRTRRRAYYLNEHQRRRGGHGKPHFVRPPAPDRLKPIPLVWGTAAAGMTNEDLYVASASRGGFVLRSREEDLIKFDLPIYPDASARAVQVMLTPLTVVADTVIVCSIVGAIAAYFWAQSRAPYDLNP